MYTEQAVALPAGSRTNGHPNSWQVVPADKQHCDSSFETGFDETIKLRRNGAQLTKFDCLLSSWRFLLSSTYTQAAVQDARVMVANAVRPSIVLGLLVRA